MRRAMRSVLMGLALLAGGSTPALAQEGFALKGFYIFNSTSGEEGIRERELPTEDGFGAGVEVVLPFGLGVGVQGYTAGETDEFDVETTEFTVLAEANYFFRLPVIPLSPYAGVHTGLGLLSRDGTDGLEIEDKTRNQLGWQVGVRFQPISLLGVDFQYRRMSTSSEENQGGRLDRNQYLLGVTLF